MSTFYTNVPDGPISGFVTPWNIFSKLFATK
jgi:hypothetical protein